MDPLFVFAASLFLAMVSDESKHDNGASQDLKDALEHVSQLEGRELQLDQFDVSDVVMLPVEDLWNYDDLSGWLERAVKWICEGSMPPIVIVQARHSECIGDGRGRVSLAVALGWKKVPVVFMRERGKVLKDFQVSIELRCGAEEEVPEEWEETLLAHAKVDQLLGEWASVERGVTSKYSPGPRYADAYVDFPVSRLDEVLRVIEEAGAEADILDVPPDTPSDVVDELRRRTLCTIEHGSRAGKTAFRE
jgi:hypothetical protein